MFTLAHSRDRKLWTEFAIFAGIIVFYAAASLWADNENRGSFLLLAPMALYVVGLHRREAWTGRAVPYLALVFPPAVAILLSLVPGDPNEPKAQFYASAALFIRNFVILFLAADLAGTRFLRNGHQILRAVYALPPALGIDELTCQLTKIWFWGGALMLVILLGLKDAGMKWAEEPERFLLGLVAFVVVAAVMGAMIKYEKLCDEDRKTSSSESRGLGLLKVIWGSGGLTIAAILWQLPPLSMDRESHPDRFFYALIALVSVVAFVGAGTECVIKRRKDPAEKIGTAINVWAVYVAASVIMGFCAMSISAQVLNPYYHGAERLKAGNAVLGGIVLVAIAGIALSTWIRARNARTAQEKFNKKWYLHPETGEYHRVLNRHDGTVFYDKRTHQQRHEEAERRRYMRKMSGLAFFAAIGAALVFFVLTKAFWGLWPAYLFAVCGLGAVTCAGAAP